MLPEALARTAIEAVSSPGEERPDTDEDEARIFDASMTAKAAAATPALRQRYPSGTGPSTSIP